MDKKEFMAMSLPYELKFNVIGIEGIKCLCGLNFIDKEPNIYAITKEVSGIFCNEQILIHLCLPILRQLSDITKPITHNGEMFIPIVELAKIMYPNYEWKLSASGNYAVVGNGYYTFEYDGGYDCFLINNSAQMPQLVCLLKLVEWHFDIAGLIDKKEAIDCNSIKNFNYYE